MRATPSNRCDARAAPRRTAIGLVLVVAMALLAVSSPALGATAAVVAPHTVAPTAALGTAGVDGESGTSTAKPIASATLTQCATATIPQTERSATFAGEMTAIAGTARMQMRVELQERIPGEPQYRTVADPALGVWRGSAPSVKVFTHIQQVSNLSAPAVYRGVLHFRWANAKGRTIKAEELVTAVCEQPAPPLSTSSGASTDTAGAVAGAAGAAS
ncbi:MAG TPA: hypothetical protein VK655_05295 [Solirubrobacteraceae bacterium]|jgi:hypothetical protein|nr:hypothetical protein [Solirubrobacteraceae bacterium]